MGSASVMLIIGANSVWDLGGGELKFYMTILSITLNKM